MINWLLSRLLDVTSMAICAFSQAKEICDCDDSSTFEQTIKVITSEDDHSSSNGHDELPKPDPLKHADEDVDQ